MNKNFKRFLSLAVVLVMVFAMFPVNVFAEESETPAANVAKVGETEYATLAEAITAANAIEGGATVTLLADVTLSSNLNITKNVTITGAHTITRGTAGTLFTVKANCTLTLDGGVILDGNNDWIFDSTNFYADLAANRTFTDVASVSYSTSEEGGIIATASMISLSGTNGALVMNQATLQNCWGSPLIAVPAGASMTMNTGSVIKHIRGQIINALKGTWTINNATITDTHHHNGNGGLVDVRDNGRFVINGGDFSHITTLGLNKNGNGILAQVYGEGTKLTINGGHFHDNASYAPGGGWGAFVYLNSGGDFEMNGGTIEKTNTNKCSAFVANMPTSIVLNAGTIKIEPTVTGFHSLFYGDVTIGENMVISADEDAVIAMLGEGGKLTIDGVIEGGTLQLMYADPDNNGVVKSDLHVVRDMDYFEFDGKVTIDSGVWLGDLIIEEDADFTITNGRFAQLKAIKYLAPGLGLLKDEYGTYTVTDQVAEVNGVVYNSVAAAEAACGEGDTIKLLAIAPVKESVIVDQTTTIDLNNNEIYATVEDVYPVFRATGDFTVTGEGGVDSVMFGSGYPFIVGNSENAGTLTIADGKHYGTTTVASVTKGTLNVEGGYFEATPYIDENGVDYGHRYTLNCIDANYNDGSAVINVTGGEFYGFDPEDNLAEGEGTNFCVVKYYSTEKTTEVEDRLSTWTVDYIDAVAYNVQDKLYFADLSDALDVADAGETVQLLKTWYEELVLVPAGVTFDLNGNVVKADNVLSFGVVMDNQEDLTKIGGIEIDIDTANAFTKLQPENGGYLPIYDTDAGMYKFFKYEVQSNAKVGGSNSVTFYTRVVFDNAEGYNILANTADSGIDFVLTMNWTGMEGFEILYYMTDANVKQYAQMAYDLVNGGNVNNKAMTATVQGVNVLGSGAYISAAPSVKTITEVTGSAEALVYNIP